MTNRGRKKPENQATFLKGSIAHLCCLRTTAKLKVHTHHLHSDGACM